MNIHPMKVAEDFLQDNIQRGTAWETNGTAILYALLGDGFLPVSKSADVYDLLADAVIPAEAQAVIVHTTGWAAPLNADGQADGAPSAHPQRRRVALMACVTNDPFGDPTMGSAIGFADTQEVIGDDGGATGSLADALAEAWAGR